MFLAGLGIFLFGMHMMEESIRLLSGGAFRALIRRYTGTRLKAILSGTFSTAILQSSSAVSLMVLAFVGAEITFLLMVNRVVTQSNRMLVFAMRELIERMDYLKQIEERN